MIDQKKLFPYGKSFDLVPKIFAVLQQFHRLLSDYPLFVGWVSISIAPTNRDLDRMYGTPRFASEKFK
ncbi:hypothetical protein C4G90_RS13950 [Vibrio parahaemolyticus]|nr:hypothetical protein [Vibrio parahaemolyticus]MDF5471490.1 hypothetical protein [Vibrio parahaemolyticus]